MPQFASDFNYDTGTLSASGQGDALMGYSGAGDGGGDMGQGLVNTILSERRRKQAEQWAREDKLRMQQQRAARPSNEEWNVQHAGNAAAIAEANARAAQGRAMTERGPQSYIFGLGYAGGPNQTRGNISQMTGAQRQVFLPKEASFMPQDVANEGAKQQARALRDQRFDEEMTGEPTRARSRQLGR